MTPTPVSKKHLALLAALSQNRGEIDPARLAELLRRIAALETAAAS
jgi:hypothetical protein